VDTLSLKLKPYHYTLLNEVIQSRTQLARALSINGAAGTIDADLYTFKMVSASAESMHAAHRSKRVCRPGRTNTPRGRILYRWWGS